MSRASGAAHHLLQASLLFALDVLSEHAHLELGAGRLCHLAHDAPKARGRLRRVCKEPRRVGGRLALYGIALSDLLQLGFRFVVRDQPGALAALHDLPHAVVDDLKVAEAGRDRSLTHCH